MSLFIIRSYILDKLVQKDIVPEAYDLEFHLADDPFFNPQSFMEQKVLSTRVKYFFNNPSRVEVETTLNKDWAPHLLLLAETLARDYYTYYNLPDGSPPRDYQYRSIYSICAHDYSKPVSYSYPTFSHDMIDEIINLFEKPNNNKIKISIIKTHEELEEMLYSNILHI